MNRFIAILFCLTFSYTTVAGFNTTNEYADSTRNFSFKFINSEDGLHQNSVFDIIQDKNGFIWFVNQVGVDRYDGDQFKLYDKTSIPGRINVVVEDTLASKLWFGHNKGLSWVSTKDYNKSEILEENKSIKAMCFLDKEKLFFSSKNDEKTYNLKLIENGKSTVIKSFESSILFLNAHNNNLLIATKNEIELFDPKSGKVIDSKKLKDITGVFIHPNNEVWIGFKNKNISRYRIDKGAIFDIDEIPNTKDAVAVLFGKRFKDIWIGLDHAGILYFPNALDDNYDFLKSKPKKIKNEPSHKDGRTINSNLILSLYESREGVIWIGTDGRGIIKYNPDEINFIHGFDKVHYDGYDFPSNDVWSIYPLPNNDSIIWLGTEGAGLIRHNLKKKDEFIINKHITNSEIGRDYNKVRCMTLLDSSFILGTADGVYKMQKTIDNSSKIVSLNSIVNSSLNLKNSLNITCLFKKHEELFIGTTEGLFVSKIQKDSIFDFNRIEDFHDKKISNIAHLQDDLICVGTRSGLFLFDIKKEIFSNIEGLENEYILSICLDSTNNLLWVGSNGAGMSKLRIKKNGSIDSEYYKLYNTEEGLPNNVIYRIEKGKNKDLWISTNKGISRFFIEDNVFVNYLESDGLQENEFNRGSSCLMNDSKLIFGGVNGFSLIDLSKFNFLAYDNKDISLIYENNGEEIVEKIYTEFNGKEIKLTPSSDPTKIKILSFDFRYSPKNFQRLKIGDIETSNKKNFLLPKEGNLYPYEYNVEYFVADGYGHNNQKGNFKVQVNVDTPFLLIFLLTISFLALSSYLYIRSTKNSKRHKKLFNVLTKIGKDFSNSNNSFDQMYPIIEKYIQKDILSTLDSDTFSIDLYNEENEELITIFDLERGKKLHREKQVKLSLNNPENINRFPIKCFKEGINLFMSDVEKDHSKYVSERKEPIAGYSKKGIIYVPLKGFSRENKSKKKSIGTISIQSAKKK